MDSLLKYVGFFVVLTVAVALLAPLGELIRDATPARFHTPLVVAGAAIAAGTLLSVSLFKSPPLSMSRRAWRISMTAGMIVGFLLFCFYISDVECSRRGRGFTCRYIGAD